MNSFCFALSFLVICIGNQQISLVTCAPDLQVVVSKSGDYELMIGGYKVLKSAPTYLVSGGKKYSTTDGSLVLNNTGYENGFDQLGEFSITYFEYVPKGLDITMVANFKTYRDHPLILIGQHFLDNVPNTSTGDKNSVCTSFPSFYVWPPATEGMKMGYLAYGGIFFGDTDKSLGVVSESGDKIVSGLDSGPVVLFDVEDRALVISPFNHFMATSIEYKVDGNDITANFGLIGTIKSIPKDVRTWTAFYYSGEGINRAMEFWGLIMRAYYNRGTEYRDSDLANNYIGYWTDNGAYYFDITEPGMNYEETMIGIKNYADSMNIPYRYLQYDYWFYPRDSNGGVLEWTSMPSIFPNGLKYLYNKTALPVFAHNMYWSAKTVYAKQNGGKYNFITDEKEQFAIPVDQEFWDDLMATAKEWGLITYEQDFINEQFDLMDATVSSVDLGRQWLLQMGEGARKSGITIQYCMSPSRSALQTLEIPNVVNARVSGDYNPDDDAWKIGISSMLASALGVAPFKDNFWTTTTQPGNPYNKSEHTPEIHSLAATLSTGPVGISDRIGYSNRTLIMRSCNSEGLILKPSRPATAIDMQIILAAFAGFQGEIWSTYSDIGRLRFGIIFASFETGQIILKPHNVGLWEFPVYKLYSAGNPSAVDFSETRHLMLNMCPQRNFCLYYASPILMLNGQEIILYGEMDKWVPISPKRIKSITVTNYDIDVALYGGRNELVNFYVGIGNKPATKITCVISPSTLSAKISVLSSSCD